MRRPAFPLRRCSSVSGAALPRRCHFVPGGERRAPVPGGNAEATPPADRQRHPDPRYVSVEGNIRLESAEKPQRHTDIESGDESYGPFQGGQFDTDTGNVRIRGEFALSASDRRGDRFRLLSLEAGRFEFAGGGEGVEHRHNRDIARLPKSAKPRTGAVSLRYAARLHCIGSIRLRRTLDLVPRTGPESGAVPGLFRGRGLCNIGIATGGLDAVPGPPYPASAASTFGRSSAAWASMISR